MTRHFISDPLPQENATKTKNMDAHDAIALLYDCALKNVVEMVSADGRSEEDVLLQLDAAKQAKDYKAQADLVEALRQRLDIADIQGKEQPQKILGALSSLYLSGQYSKARQSIMLDKIPRDDLDVLIFALLDKKFSDSNHLLYSLEDNEIRKKIYQILIDKNEIDRAVTLISTTKYIPEKIYLFEKITAWLKQNPSEEAEKIMSAYGSYAMLRRDIGIELLKRDREAFTRLVADGIFGLDGLEDYLIKEPDESLTDILLHVVTVDDALRVIKFIRSKATLLVASSELSQAVLPQESRSVVTKTIQRLIDAFEAPPQFYSLGYLSKKDRDAKSYEISNKFIIALRDGERRATIAWSNTQNFFEHKQLAQRIGNVTESLCAGGEVEINPLENERLQVVFKGRSGTYGPFNCAFLEHFKKAIEEQLRHELGAEIEVVIHESKF